MSRPIQLSSIDSIKTINVNPLTARDTFNQCSFQDKLNLANTGLSGAYKEIFIPVSKISSSIGEGQLVSNYSAFDPERPNGDGNVYNEKEPKPYPNWFSNLNPYDTTTNTYKIQSDLAAETKRIQEKYYPNGVPSPHPAFDPYFDKFGGSRNASITPVIDIDTSIPPFMNMYFFVKKISDNIKGKSSFLPTQLPPGIQDFSEAIKPVVTTPTNNITL